MRSLHQSSLDFQLAETRETITSKSGLAVVHELALSLGVVETIANELPAPGSNRSRIRFASPPQPSEQVVFGRSFA